MLILTNDDVAKVLTIEGAIEALRISNREIYDFRIKEHKNEFRLDRPRTNCYLPWKADQAKEDQSFPGVNEDTRILYNFKSMEGGSLHFGMWAVRSSSDLVRFNSNSNSYGPSQTYLRYGDLPGGKGYSDLVFLYNTFDAQFEAIIHAAALQGIRVAATSALGVDYLCRTDVTKLGLFGSGWQAAANLRALLHVRPSIDQVVVFSPNFEHCSQFAVKQSAALGIQIIPARQPEQAVLDMDIICEATSSTNAVFDGDLLKPGQHIVSIGAGDNVYRRRPIDPKAVARCDKIVVHTLDVRLGLDEIEDCVAAQKLNWDSIVDLPELIGTDRREKANDNQITFFKNNVGLGTQFAAVGGLVLAQAKKQGLGFTVPQELVSQVMSR